MQRSLGTGRLAVNFATILVSSLASSFAGFLFSVFLARTVTKEEFGVFSTAQVFVALAVAFSDAGLANVIVRDVAQKPGEFSRIAASFLGLKLALGVLVSIAAIVLARLIFGSTSTYLAIAVFGLSVGPQTLLYTVASLAGGKERLHYAAIAHVANILGYAITAVQIALGYGLTVVFATLSILHVAACIFALKVVQLRFAITKLFVLDFAGWRTSLTNALPFAVGSLFTIVSVSLPPLLLARYAGTAEVATFSAANRIAQIFMLVVAAYNSSVYPVFSRLSSTASASLAQVFNVSMKLMFACGLPLIGVMFVYADDAVRLLFPRYLESVLTLRILMLYVFFSLLATVSLNVLYAEGNQSRGAAVLVSSASVAMVISVSTIPVGVNIGAPISLVVITVLQFMLSASLLGRGYQVTSLALPLAKIAIMGLITTLVLYFAQTEALIVQAVALIGIACMYVLCVMTLGVFSEPDFELIQSLPFARPVIPWLKRWRLS